MTGFLFLASLVHLTWRCERAIRQEILTVKLPHVGCAHDAAWQVTESGLRVANLQLRRLDYLISDGLLHEVHLTLPDNLHQLILQRNSQFGFASSEAGWSDGINLEFTLQLLEASSAAALRYKRRRAHLHGRMNKERIILVAEVEVAREMRRVQHVRGVTLHFKQVVLVLPDERSVLELLDVILVRSHLVVLISRQQEVIDQLLAPLNDAAHDM